MAAPKTPSKVIKSICKATGNNVRHYGEEDQLFYFFSVT